MTLSGFPRDQSLGQDPRTASLARSGALAVFAAEPRLFANAEAVEDAVHNVCGNLSAVKLAKLTHCKLKLCAGGVRAKHIQCVKCVLCVFKRF